MFKIKTEVVDIPGDSLKLLLRSLSRSAPSVRFTRSTERLRPRSRSRPSKSSFLPTSHSLTGP